MPPFMTSWTRVSVQPRGSKVLKYKVSTPNAATTALGADTLHAPYKCDSYDTSLTYPILWNFHAKTTIITMRKIEALQKTYVMVLSTLPGRAIQAGLNRPPSEPSFGPDMELQGLVAC